MKRILVGLLIVLFLALSAIYIFIPGKLIISSASRAKANREGVYRMLTNRSNWQKWWPGTVSRDSKDSLLFAYEGYEFHVENIFYNFIRIRLVEDHRSSGSLFRLIPFAPDSLGIEMSLELHTQVDPFNRIATYFRAKKIKSAFDGILTSLTKYAADLKNLYGIDVKNEKVQYQNLLSAKRSFSHYPTTQDIYAIIGRMREYVYEAGAKELFSPMLNISQPGNKTYTAQVGIPVDKPLPPKDDITLKMMMKGGNILTSEVTGGQQRIEDAQKQMELYISDYQRSIIAIPFQMLVTDRTKEPDSTKWVTRIYYPVV